MGFGIYWDVRNLDQFDCNLKDTWRNLGALLFDSDEPQALVEKLAIPVLSDAQTDADFMGYGDWAGDRVYCSGLPIDDQCMEDYEDGMYVRIDTDDIDGSVPHSLRPARPGFPSDRVWVLRNLSKRQYVRADAIASKPENVNGPFITPGPGLGEVVLLRTLHCDDPVNTGMSYKDGEFVSGVWAGDHFDITTIDQVETVIDGGMGWEDISAEVAREISEIWECEYGENWRNRK